MNTVTGSTHPSYTLKFFKRDLQYNLSTVFLMTYCYINNQYEDTHS